MTIVERAEGVRRRQTAALLDKTYIASANNITDSINTTTGLQNPGSILAATGTGSIYAGAPRTFVAGMKLAFR
jgi:iron complex outermembrane receptor protein